MQEEGDERESICPSTHPSVLTCMCSLTHPTSTFDKTLFFSCFCRDCGLGDFSCFLLLCDERGVIRGYFLFFLGVCLIAGI